MNLLDRTKPAFPPVERALEDPNGLLAVGGDLSPEWLLSAYRHGIFPWFDDDDGPTLWWSPDPRTVLFPAEVRVTRSLAKRLRNGGFTITFDRAFEAVIAGCAAPRRGAEGTWITPRMIDAYTELHELGLAHSVETWLEDDTGGRRLAGGLYGVSLGRMFFGESMFARAPDASKVAFVHLCRVLEALEFTLIDCQVGNPHLDSLGAVTMERAEFIRLVERNAHEPTLQGSWSELAGRDAPAPAGPRGRS
jgi:leucyl/phenylalanyl-tRNA--protein transferase